jgi:hypothetical protein
VDLIARKRKKERERQRQRQRKKASMCILYTRYCSFNFFLLFFYFCLLSFSDFFLFIFDWLISFITFMMTTNSTALFLLIIHIYNLSNCNLIICRVNAGKKTKQNKNNSYSGLFREITVCSDWLIECVRIWVSVCLYVCVCVCVWSLILWI